MKADWFCDALTADGVFEVGRGMLGAVRAKIRARKFGQLNGSIDRSKGQSEERSPDSDRATFDLHKVATVVFGSLATLLLAHAPVLAAGQPFMTLPGNWGVSSTGAFTYTIPIDVPPGTAGMIPHLAVQYSSDGGDGFMGLGWSLQGLSAVTRCPRTMAQDGVHGGVNYDGNDRYCLDGQRLILISGTYGADNSQYRTEIDSYNKIVAHNSNGWASGPAWFEVHTRDGKTIQLGNSTSSQILAVGKTNVVRVWAVNQITDPIGNYVAVTYVNDATNGQYYPSSINYTGNASQSLSPYNSVQFVYTRQTRPDFVPTYQAGSLMQWTVLLGDIQTYTGSTLVRDYQLNYNLAAPTTFAHDELATVKMCDSALNTAWCLAKSTFSWQGSGNALTVSTKSPTIAQGIGLASGDFNGDGLTDAIVLPQILPPAQPPMPNCSSSGNIYYGSESGGLSSANATASYPYFLQDSQTTSQYSGPSCFENYSPHSPIVGDVNGDGVSDLQIPIMTYQQFLSGWLTYPSDEYVLSNGSGQLNFVGNQAQYNVNFGVMAGINTFPSDFNGDGLSDILVGPVVLNGQLVAAAEFGKGDGTFTAADSGHAGLNFSDTWYYGDFDGDGCTDILTQGSTYNNIVFFCNPISTQVTVPYWQQNGAKLVVGDFNGDGKTDVIVITGSGATLYLANGDGFATGISVYSGSSWWSNTVIVGDWNGDGKADLAVLISGQAHQLWLSNGAGFVQNTTTIPNTETGGFSAVVADWNNDGAQDLYAQNANGDKQYFFSYQPELMTTVTTNIGATTTVTYDRLNQNSLKEPNATLPFYTKGTGAAYPTQEVDKPVYVVARVDNSNGSGNTCAPPAIANCLTHIYSYTGYRTDLQGRGGLGFESVADTYLNAGNVTTTNFVQTFPCIGMVSSQTIVNGSTTLRTITNTFKAQQSTVANPTPFTCGSALQGSAPFFVYKSQSVASGKDLNGATLPTTTVQYTLPDNYGNIQQIAKTVSYSNTQYLSSTVTVAYNNDTGLWQLGQVVTSQIQNIVPIGNSQNSNITRNYIYCYYLNYIPGGSDPSCTQQTTDTGQLQSAQVEPQVAQLNLKAVLTYDPFGNMNNETLTGYGLTSSRSFGPTYDSQGQFPTTFTNALSEQETRVFNAGYGEQTKLTGVNGVPESTTYDQFGRIWSHTNTDKTFTFVDTQPCSGTLPDGESCPQTAKWFVLVCPEIVWHSGMKCPISTGNGNLSDQKDPMTVTFYDSLNRVVATDRQGFDGSWTRTSTSYDANGHVYQVSRPYFLATGTPYYTTYTNYDALDRVGTVTYPDGSYTTYTYNGLMTTVKTTPTQNASQPNAESTTTTRNALGQVVSVTDANSKNTTYVWDAFGCLLSTTDPGSNTTTNVCDTLGRKTQTTDPDMGGQASASWSYGYDALNELTSQTDAKGQNFTFTYDPLGRMATRSEPDMASTWTYGIQNVNQTTYPNSAGQIVVENCTGTACAESNYTRNYFYDTKGRQDELQEQFGTNSYQSSETYDDTVNKTGKISSVTAFSGYTTNNVYNQAGYLSGITDSASNPIWAANSADAELHLTGETAGNNFLTTSSTYYAQTGLIQQITANTSPNATTFNYQWDSFGNLANRQDMQNGGITENFCYDTLNRLQYYAVNGQANGQTPACQVAGTGYVTHSTTYDSAGLGNIASKSDVGTYTYSGGTAAGPHAVTSITGTVNGVVNPTFSYDTNGNMTAGDGRTISYTSFNMTSRIIAGGGSNGAQLSYDPDHARAEMCVPYCNRTIPAPITHYMNDPVSGSVSELVTTGNQTPTWRTYVMADGAIVAEQTVTGSTTNVLYMVGDHLQSIARVQPSSGSLEYDSYDAWGRRRNADYTDSATCPPQASLTTRGYTGQEMLDQVCLVNLNGRIYDPTIGRMMSADPVVQYRYDGQSYNRYTYVENGPLSAIDPTGYDLAEPVVVTGSRYHHNDGCDGGCGGPGNNGNGQPGGGGGGGGNDGAPEVVVVTAPKWHPPTPPPPHFSILALILPSAMAGTPNSQDPSSPHCSQALMDKGNEYRRGAHNAAVVSAEGLGVSLSIVAGGALWSNLDTSAGGEAVVGGTAGVLASLGGFTYAGWEDSIGTSFQAAAGAGNTADAATSAIMEGVGELIDPVGQVLDFAGGVVNALGPAPAAMSCSAG